MGGRAVRGRSRCDGSSASHRAFFVVRHQDRSLRGFAALIDRSVTARFAPTAVRLAHFATT
jgi:hypothetical protein